jgi:RecB family exonuclease
VSPSRAAALAECGLRVAYQLDESFAREVPSTPAARLGSVCHRVLERAARGDSPQAGERRTAFEHLWDDELAREMRKSEASPGEGHWPPPQRWPNYAIRKARTRRLAERLFAAQDENGKGATPSSRSAETLHEHSQSAFGGLLQGRADVIKRGSHTVIEDYKTGSIYESGTEEIRRSYRLQLLLYAVLEHAETGVWPSHAILIPLEGEREEFPIDPKAAADAGEAAVSELQQFNAVVLSTGPQSLASASPDHCRFCEYSVRCPAFWDAITTSWGEQGVVATRGQLLRVAQSRFDTLDIEMQPDAGSLDAATVRVHGLSAEQFSDLQHVRAGTAAAATGLRPGDAPGLARPTLRTRVVRGS